MGVLTHLRYPWLTKVVNAGGSIYAAPRSTTDSLLWVALEGCGVEPRGSSPIFSPSMTEAPSRSRVGGALFKYFSGESPPGAASLRRTEVGQTPVGGRLAITGTG